jgi:hypothetical protein
VLIPEIKPGAEEFVVIDIGAEKGPVPQELFDACTRM